MNILSGIQNFLMIINDNWTMILVIAGLMISIGQKVKTYLTKSNDEKVEIAKKQIQEMMLKMITDAEFDNLAWDGAGKIKRSQVIEKIFTMYPILSKVTDQEGLLKWIDTTIDESLVYMREIFEGFLRDDDTQTMTMKSNV